MFRPSLVNLAKLNVEGLAKKVNLSSKPVLCRVDLNVPLDKTDGVTVTDDTRLRAIQPTAKFLLDQNAKLILCSHLGQPKGVITETGKNGRLNFAVPHLEKLLKTKVHKADDCVGPEVEKLVSEMKGGEVLLLENTRFHLGETNADPILSKGLAKLASVFVMDAFGTSHRNHSSTAGVTKHMDFSAAGFLMEKEILYLKGAVDEPTRPLCAIVGGAKVSTKIPVIESLIEKCDKVLIGGGMIFTFYKALGYDVGSSLVEEDMIPLAKELMKMAKEKGVMMLLPSDVVIADQFDKDANTDVVNAKDGIADGWMGLDIGPDTIKSFATEMEVCNTIVWNGPMGVFEFPKFATGTTSIAEIMAKATGAGAITIVGGGDSVAAVNQAGLGEDMSHISTGGGASLELLEGKVLPGVDALTEV